MLARLVARDFRNFAHLDITLPDSGFAIVGENGHGKTNLLEAVAYLSLLRSLRGARDADVVRFGANVFHIRAELDGTNAFDSVAVGYDRQTKKKRASLDGVDQTRLTSALGALPSVCFSPADVVLVAGARASAVGFSTSPWRSRRTAICMRCSNIARRCFVATRPFAPHSATARVQQAPMTRA